MKRRKVPISNIARTNTLSSKQKTSRNVIRRFHILIKSKVQLKNKNSLTVSEKEELDKINDEIQRLGGLEWYQQMSVVGQGNDRGGGSEKIFIEWLKELQVHEGKQEKLQYVIPGLLWPTTQDLALPCGSRLLEVGALKPNNYKFCTSWIHNTPIDLHSRHPDIKEQDFLLLDPSGNKKKWSAVSLSLVLNFVPEPRDRGEQSDQCRLNLLNNTKDVCCSLLTLSSRTPDICLSRFVLSSFLLFNTDSDSFPCPVSLIHVIWHLTILISSWKPLDSSSSSGDGRKGVKWHIGFFRSTGNTSQRNLRDFWGRVSFDQETGTISQSFYSVSTQSESCFRPPMRPSF